MAFFPLMLLINLSLLIRVMFYYYYEKPSLATLCALLFMINRNPAFWHDSAGYVLVLRLFIHANHASFGNANMLIRRLCALYCTV